MRCADANVNPVNTVDIFNATSGVWTTAALSVARPYIAATSLPNDGLAIFAGGLGASYVLMSVIAGGWCVGRGRVCGRGEVCYCCCCWLLMRCADAFDNPVNTVDIFNARSGVWTNANLSVARYYLAAISLPNDGLAIFAGGSSASYVLM